MHSEYDLVDGTFCWCVEKNLHRKRFFGGNNYCQIIHDVWHAKGIIGNGGFHRFFDIASKANVKSVVNAYKTVMLDRCAEIISVAGRAYNASKAKLANQNVDADADAIRHPIDEDLSSLEREFYDMSDVIIESLAKYIKRVNPRGDQ
ncbi:DUF4375 domain-containing protein [Prosthecobacter sp.]|uniref:DMP19 family protein n=1 Tax=Prosthecobacter sp. TaxID=1965333 RepID=UPI003783037F